MQDKQVQLKKLPSVDIIQQRIIKDPRFSSIPKSVIMEAIRTTIDLMRKKILDNIPINISAEIILDNVADRIRQKIASNLIPVINATGVILHTNLGRALLCEEALSNIAIIARGYSNLELNIATGKRGIRYSVVENLLCELTGAEKAIVVNNNAGAVLLTLNTLARNNEVVVSRGELIEIGGSFRIPDIMTQSGCVLKEVGTTNRTYLQDYSKAISEKTGMLLKIHTSNYKINGFTAAVSIKELANLGREKNIPIMGDLGSGTMIDFSKYGIAREPRVSEQVAAGADIVTFSGDKLLGGPQAGIIVGKKEYIDAIKKNPLMRALRIDKMTLAALEPTLKLYRDETKAIKSIPSLKMITMNFEETCRIAQGLMKSIKRQVGDRGIIQTIDLTSRPGGGAFPEIGLPTRCVTVKSQRLSAARIEKQMRLYSPPIIGRIENDFYIIDPRTLQAGQDIIIATALGSIL